MTEEPKKRCTKCARKKRLSLFARDRRAIDGRMSACKSCCKKSKRLSRYGVCPEQWKELNRQFPRCPICNYAGENFPCIDHDHQTGAVRGLLCQRCNKGIGLLGDNIAGVQKALIYLQKGYR